MATQSLSDTGRDKKGHLEASVEKGATDDRTTAPRSYGEVARQSSARVEEGVLAKVKADRRVRVEAQSGKCMVDAMAKAREVVGDRMEGENLVIIHAGLNDVLKGRSQNIQRQLEAGVRKLREVSESVQITICAIPEVQGQSSGMQRRVVEANRVIRGMSRQLGYTIMDVNRDVNELGFRPFAWDGIHYSGATGRRAAILDAATRVGEEVAAMLSHMRGRRGSRPAISGCCCVATCDALDATAVPGERAE
ncbi:hypothetical protein HPB50_028638 [Hyalomma asiaticum]|nr:hypothetical protein HPB50_028638 [Hyalomma asiaticum]